MRSSTGKFEFDIPCEEEQDACNLTRLEVTENGTYLPDPEDGYYQVDVNVPSVTPADNGKVVVNGELVSQTSTTITSNGTHDTTTNNSAIVNVPNSYSASDEGKVVSSGALVAQGSQTITQNGTYDTTLIAQLIANISGGGGGAKNILGGTTAPTSSDGTDGDIYIQYSDYGTFPAGYTALEYLGVGSSVGAYIDTGLTSSSNISCELEVQFTSNPNNNTWFYGAFQSYGAPILGYQNGRVEGYIVSGGVIQAYDTNPHVYKVDANGIHVDGALKQAGNWSSAPTGVPLYLFSRGGDNAKINNTRITYCKMWNSGTLARNFVPAKRNLDDVLGMYDLVNDIFYTNAGSGTFTGGSVLTGTPIDFVILM